MADIRGAAGLAGLKEQFDIKFFAQMAAVAYGEPKSTRHRSCFVYDTALHVNDWWSTVNRAKDGRTRPPSQ